MYVCVFGVSVLVCRVVPEMYGSDWAVAGLPGHNVADPSFTWRRRWVNNNAGSLKRK
jgi:hypothetical protein